MFSFGHCPNEGGGRHLPESKNVISISIFDGRKRCTSCPKEGEGGGEVIRAMPKENIFFYVRASLITKVQQTIFQYLFYDMVVFQRYNSSISYYKGSTNYISISLLWHAGLSKVQQSISIFQYILLVPDKNLFYKIRIFSRNIGAIIF